MLTRPKAPTSASPPVFVGPQASCEKGLLGLPLAYHRASLLLCLGEDLPQLRLSKDVHEFHLVSLPETSH